MRLLNTATLTLETFIGIETPRYAILSHTWGKDEVLFEDIQDISTERWKEKLGARKVIASARKAFENVFSYIWIDTCCIDKSSSAELSEAINSMYQWYAASDVCYAYLSDVGDKIEGCVPFEQSRWFSRGWTLQELIAPREVEIFDAKWKPIGTRSSLATAINSITRIDMSLLERNPEHQYEMEDRLEAFSIHSKMLWTCKRETTRPEDRAYSLMGIFNVNMPLLYGEGGNKAFQRLQEEIIKASSDQSILLHTQQNGPLARSPDQFLPTHTFQQNPKRSQYLLERVKNGLRISLLLYPLRGSGLTLGIVDSLFADDPSKLCRPALWLTNTERDSEYCLFFEDTLRVQPIASGDVQVIDNSNKIIVSSIDQNKLQRKVIHLCKRVDWRNRLPVSTMISPTLSLRPIVHKISRPVYEYGMCYPNVHGHTIPIDYSEPIVVFRDLCIMAAVSLQIPPFQRPSIIVLIFAHSWSVVHSSPTAVRSIAWGIQEKYNSRKRTFAHLVYLSDWLGSDMSTYCSLPGLRQVRELLPRLPIVRQNSLCGDDQIASALLRSASEQERGSECCMETSSGIRITVQLNWTPYLEEELLTVNVEISDSKGDSGKLLKANKKSNVLSQNNTPPTGRPQHRAKRFRPPDSGQDHDHD
ncbi:HET-domain-containing protein [Xylariaceae sp. AK1471]|nr:HET-domain-containing protein [Xylariaceae sp. AK1471]